MKAARWHGRNDIRIEEVPDPGAPGPGEVILRVAYCGICGTDLEEYRAGPLFIPVERPHPLTGRQAPLILGHEFAGEVVAVGPGVTDLRPGDRVAPDVLITCGRCYWCQRHQVTLCEQMAALGLSGDGGLAEYCRAPATMCVKLPPTLRLDHAALAEPLAVAVRAVRKSRLQVGETAAVFGGGTIGLLCLQVARAAGASAVVVVEPHPGRRRLAEDLGARAVLDPAADPVAALRTLFGGIGPDVVIEASGAVTAAPLAIESARKGGRVVLVGLPVGPTAFNFFAVVTTEKEIIGSLSHVYDEDFRTAVHLLAEGRVVVEPLISARIPLTALLTEGLERLERQPAETLKILVTPASV